MSAAVPEPESSTNSIEIFIDSDGLVTFTDLPEELRQVAESLAQFEVEPVSWCELYPQPVDATAKQADLQVEP